MHVVPRPGDPDGQVRAAAKASSQWQAWNLLPGQAEPELDGAPGWLDAVGVNHHHLSQWELDTGVPLDRAARDPRRPPVAALLHTAWARYGRPLAMAETSHVGVHRVDWLHDILGQERQARSDGVPVDAVCVYPLVDRPDWNDTLRWHRSGLWHVHPATLSRSADAPTLHALRQWRAALLKIDPASLPQRPNLHWFGPLPYRVLARPVRAQTAADVSGHPCAIPAGA